MILTCIYCYYLFLLRRVIIYFLSLPISFSCLTRFIYIYVHIQTSISYLFFLSPEKRTRRWLVWFFHSLYVHKWFQQNNWVYLTRIGAVACLEDKQATDNSLERNGTNFNAYYRDWTEITQQTCSKKLRVGEKEKKGNNISHSPEYFSFICYSKK